MDWGPDQDAALDAIEENGVAMSLVTTIATASYVATTDSIAATIATYSIYAVITNPTMRRESGEYAKSDRVRLLIPAKGLPTNLEELEFKVVYGSTVWHPASTVPLKPGGTPILFTVDMQ